MIAPKTRASKAIARTERETDLAMSVGDAPKGDAPIVSKKPRLRGRARAQVAAKPAVIAGPSSKRPPKLAPGVRITRTYKGKKISVLVIDDRQFEYAGEKYRSLSAIANKITGSHVSGNAWFGLVGKKKEAKS